MLSLALAMALAQPAACAPEAVTFMSAATRLAREFDLASAASGFELAVARGCETARIPAIYIRGLIAAREASRQGGSEEALAPVKAAADTLQTVSKGVPGPAEIARLVLVAAAAAAQSERGEMSVYLEHAMQMEALQLAANAPGAPVISAHEAAGDLWLQVHRYEDARNAYLRAQKIVGLTPRLTVGLARAAARLNDRAAACAEYSALLADRPRPSGSGGAGAATLEPEEIAEARAFVFVSSCATAPAGAPSR